MAPLDRKPPTKPAEKPWRQAALGGVLVALGGALFRLGRKPDPQKQRPASPPSSKERLRGKAGSTGKASPAVKAGGTGKASPAVKAGWTGKASPAVKAGGKERQRESSKPQHWPPPSAKDAKRPRHPTDDGRPEHPLPVNATSEKLGYEVKDTRAGTLAIIMVVSVAIIGGSITGLFSLIGHYRSVDARAAPLTPQQLAVIVPPGPHLQGHPLHDIAEERKREADLLDRYAWIDPGHERARIPIERAQALVLGKPLDPAPSPAPQP